MSLTSRTELFSPEYFRGSFNLEEFAQRLCNDATSAKEEDSEDNQTTNPEAKAKETKKTVQSLLEHFKKSESRLRSLHVKVTEQLSEAQNRVESEQKQYKEVTEVTDRQFSDLRRDFSVMDTKIANFGHISARIGEKLKHFHEHQSRAENALELIEHLQCFSNVKEKGDFSVLPAVFTDNNRLPEAAEIAQRLTVLTADLASAKARTGSSVDGPAPRSPYHGGLHDAVSALQDYCNDLENRVVRHFDQCTSEDDEEGMHQYACVMAKLNKEMILAQRYISSRPMFFDIDKVQFGESSSLALMDLQNLYREILLTVKHESQVIENVFPSPKKAMELFLQRVMEQRVRSVLDRILIEPGGIDHEIEPEEIRDFVRLVGQVYEKTHTLAINLERVTIDDLNLLDMCDSLVSDYISSYPQVELDWLSKMYTKQESLKSDNALSLSSIKVLIEWNKEAILRCKALSSGDVLAPRVRQLFHSSTYYYANLGCLLEQSARHIMHGLRHCCEECEMGSNMLLSSSSLHDLGNKTISISTSNLVSHGIGKMLDGVNITTQIIEQLQQHFRSVVEPNVVSSVAETAACISGLAALIKAIEEKLLEDLKNALHLFFTQVEKVLSFEQKRSEYRPSAGTAMVFDRPTVACQLVCSLIDELRIKATENLKPQNLTAFLEEVGCEASACLSVHITHFTFSPSGALRLKRDMAEYIDTLRKFNSSEILNQFETLQQLVNVFIVAPESLLGLVDGTLRMSHRDALKYVQLREDFKTAKVEGQSLTQLFTSERNDFD